jgi:hypothetical protein
MTTGEIEVHDDDDSDDSWLWPYAPGSEEERAALGRMERWDRKMQAMAQEDEWPWPCTARLFERLAKGARPEEMQVLETLAKRAGYGDALSKAIMMSATFPEAEEVFDALVLHLLAIGEPKTAVIERAADMVLKTCRDFLDPRLVRLLNRVWHIRFYGLPV